MWDEQPMRCSIEAPCLEYRQSALFDSGCRLIFIFTEYIYLYLYGLYQLLPEYYQPWNPFFLYPVRSLQSPVSRVKTATAQSTGWLD